MGRCEHRLVLISEGKVDCTDPPKPDTAADKCNGSIDLHAKYSTKKKLVVIMADHGSPPMHSLPDPYQSISSFAMSGPPDRDATPPGVATGAHSSLYGNGLSRAVVLGRGVTFDKLVMLVSSCHSSALVDGFMHDLAGDGKTVQTGVAYGTQFVPGQMVMAVPAGLEEMQKEVAKLAEENNGYSIWGCVGIYKAVLNKGTKNQVDACVQNNKCTRSQLSGSPELTFGGGYVYNLKENRATTRNVGYNAALCGPGAKDSVGMTCIDPYYTEETATDATECTLKDAFSRRNLDMMVMTLDGDPKKALFKGAVTVSFDTATLQCTAVRRGAADPFAVLLFPRGSIATPQSSTTTTLPTSVCYKMSGLYEGCKAGDDDMEELAKAKQELLYNPATGRCEKIAKPGKHAPGKYAALKKASDEHEAEGQQASAEWTAGERARKAALDAAKSDDQKAAESDEASARVKQLEAEHKAAGFETKECSCAIIARKPTAKKMEKHKTKFTFVFDTRACTGNVQMKTPYPGHIGSLTIPANYNGNIDGYVPEGYKYDEITCEKA